MDNRSIAFLSNEESAYQTENETILIDTVYSEGIFNNFIRYCRDNNLLYMRDLKDFDFNSLSNIKGFGKERVSRIAFKYSAVMLSDSLNSKSLESTSHPSLQDTISDVYSENKYKIFRQYCADSGYETVSDLMRLDFDKLLSVEGIGIVKLTQIKAKYTEIMLSGNESQADSVLNFSEELKNAGYDIHPDYSGIDISFIYGNKICEALYKRNIKAISDLAGISASDFRSVPGMGLKRVGEELERIKLYELPITEFVVESFASIRKEKEYQYYREVVYNKKTLEQVGKESNLTRERIRQKKNKIEQLALPVVALFEEVVIKSGLLDNIVSFDFETLSDLIGSYDSAAFAKDIFANCVLHHIRYSNAFDLFFIDKDPDEISVKLKNIINQFGAVISFVDEMVNIEELLLQAELEFIDVFSFPEYLLRFGYRKYNDYYIKGRPSLERISDIILQKHFASGIENTAEDISEMRRLINQEFGIELSEEGNDRNLWAILDRPNNHIVLWGKSRKIHIDHVLVNDSVLESIKNKITKELGIIPSISSDYIYEQAKPMLESTGSNIQCKEALYGVLQHYFSDLFSFRKLTIKAADNTANIQEMLESYITENNGIVSMISVKQHFSKWTYVMINAAINFNSNILSWDNGNSLILASSLHLSDDFSSKFKQKIDDSFVDGYTNAYMISRTAKVLLLRSKINDDAVSVYSLAKHLFSDDYFFTRRPHILKAAVEKQFTSVDLVLILYKRKKVISYGEMKEWLINDYAVDDVGAGNQIAKAQPYLFQLDIDKYCLPENVTYSPETADACMRCVESLVLQKGYAILSEIDKTDICKHSIDVAGTAFSINAYTAKSIITKEYSQKYRFIVRKNYDWRYDNSIVVPATSSIITFADAIIYLLVNEFSDKENFTLPNIERFLRKKELIINKISDEFFNSDKITIDEFGRAFVRNEDQDVV